MGLLNVYNLKQLCTLYYHQNVVSTSNCRGIFDAFSNNICLGVLVSKRFNKKFVIQRKIEDFASVFFKRVRLRAEIN